MVASSPLIRVSARAFGLRFFDLWGDGGNGIVAPRRLTPGSAHFDDLGFSNEILLLGAEALIDIYIVNLRQMVVQDAQYVVILKNMARLHTNPICRKIDDQRNL